MYELGMRLERAAPLAAVDCQIPVMTGVNGTGDRGDFVSLGGRRVSNQAGPGRSIQAQVALLLCDPLTYWTVPG